MKVTITCSCPQTTEHIYELLSHPLSGHGCLIGQKECTEEHIMVPDIMEFDLTSEEIEHVSQLPGVVSVVEENWDTTLDYEKVGQTGIPRLASFTTSFGGNNDVKHCIPHSLYYGQNYRLTYTHEFPTNGETISLSSIDCSNVDVIVMDSGVDPSHPDLTDQNGNPLVVQFDWSKLREGDPVNGPRIINALPTNYYQDSGGHGTACASLIAGRRCGFAKNAKIYSLRAIRPRGDDGPGFISGTDALKLALAFQLAKSQNLHGLSSNRPTVFSNSWSSTGPSIISDEEITNQDQETFKNSIDYGKSSALTNRAVGQNTAYDGYFRQIVASGIHTLKSAGNINWYLDRTKKIDCHRFQQADKLFICVRTASNNASFALNQTYGNGYIYKGTVSVPFYVSPYIGPSDLYSKTSFPVIIVGDVTPIGSNDADASTYGNGSNSNSVYTTLNANAVQPDSRIVVDLNQVRYNSVTGPFFVKSSYSCFGPDVDLYAPGNGTWAAISNQSTVSNLPTFSISVNEKYRSFDGTSAATPITAGILATYVSQFPTASPLQAKTWLLSNSISGNIMQTQKTTNSINSFDGATAYTVQLPHGSDINKVSDLSLFKFTRNASRLSLYKTGNMDELLFHFRFFDSNNLMPQAYPLRRAVLNSTASSATVAQTNLVRGTQVEQRITHK